MRLFGFVQALSLLALGGAVSAQSLDATINGSAANPDVSNGVVTVDIGNVTTDTVVHVFDDSTTSTIGPSTALSQVILRGTVSTGVRSEARAGAVGWSSCWCIGRVLRLGDDTTG
ncbi:MAG: hypothetical protein KF768_09440 [Phycisphaeraceae bacterium]|nr:hypothetical protein [Phycisphaeraceae bacterium]